MAARAKYGADDTPKIKPKNDVYTGLLAIALVGMLVSCLLLFLDWNSYPDQGPAKPNLGKLPGVKGYQEPGAKAP
jgi:hypothetical protein